HGRRPREEAAPPAASPLGLADGNGGPCARSTRGPAKELSSARHIHSITNGEADACDQTIRAVVQPHSRAGVNFEVIRYEIDNTTNRIVSRPALGSVKLIYGIPFRECLELLGDLEGGGNSSRGLEMRRMYFRGILPGNFVVSNEDFNAKEVLHNLPAHVDVQSTEGLVGSEDAVACWYHHLRDHRDGWKKLALLGQRELHAKIEILGAIKHIGHPTYLLLFVEKVLSDSKFEPVR